MGILDGRITVKPCSRDVSYSFFRTNEEDFGGGSTLHMAVELDLVEDLLVIHGEKEVSLRSGTLTMCNQQDRVSDEKVKQQFPFGVLSYYAESKNDSSSDPASFGIMLYLPPDDYRSVWELTRAGVRLEVTIAAKGLEPRHEHCAQWKISGSHNLGITDYTIKFSDRAADSPNAKADDEQEPGQETAETFKHFYQSLNQIGGLLETTNKYVGWVIGLLVVLAIISLLR